MFQRKKSSRIFSFLMVMIMLFGTLPTYANNGMELLPLDQGNQYMVENYIEKIDPAVQELFSQDNELIDVLVYMKDKADVFGVSKNNAIGKTPFAKELSSRKAVINELKNVAEESQVNLLNYLDSFERNGEAEFVKSFHIVNIVHVKATKNVIESIAQMPEVKTIYLNGKVELEEPVINDMELQAVSDDEIEWNIKQVAANAVWEKLGIDGTGVVVGIIDSGVKWDHPALKEKWRGYNPVTGATTAEGNWFDPINKKALPEDPTSFHGSHVAGTVLGQEADGTNAIGVAPGAKWIAANGFTGPLAGNHSILLECAQWMLAPGGKAENAPDIVNNSWGGQAIIDPWFAGVVDSWRAANILPVFAAGNQKSGEAAPWPGSIQNPANLLTVFSVGATDINNIRGSFSKLGPSLYDPEGKVYKPDISAPGVGIRSAAGDGTYVGGWNGTSMAAPHIAGVAALMKSANASLTIAEMENIMEETAIPLTDNTYPTSPNMGYGYGLVNAFDAVSEVLGNGQGTIEGNVYTGGEDTQEPIIVHEGVEDVYIGEEVIITANIKDDVSITEAVLLVKNKDINEYNEIKMKLKSGNAKDGIYEAIIPGSLVVDGGVDYKIRAKDFGGNIVTASDYRVNILFGIKPDEYSNDFEKDIKGWRLTGDWEWGEPTSASNPKPTSGQKIIGTKLATYDTSENIVSTLTMPSIDLRDTSMKSASLEFNNWNNISGMHKANMNISLDGGITWKILRSFKDKTEGWLPVYIDLSQYIGNLQPVMINFEFNTIADFGFSVGWFIDDLKLKGLDTTPPAIPKELKTKTEISGIVLNWNKVMDSDLDKYNIYRSRSQGGPYEKLGSTSNLNYLDSDVINEETYYYVITAVDFAGNESNYSDEVQHTYLEMKIIFAASFEEDNGGFTTGIIPIELPYGSPKNDWAWGLPTSGPRAALTGTKVWATKLNGNYDWDHSGYIESPAIEILEDVNAVLYVDQWLDANNYVYNGTIDFANIQISEDDGATWTVLGSNMSGTKKWETISRDLSEYKGKSIKLRFYLFSNGTMNAPGWYIDSVYILPAEAGANLGIKTEKEDILELDNQRSSNIEGVLPLDATVTILETGRSVRTNLTDGSFTMKHAASEAGKPWTMVVESYGYHSKEISIDLSAEQIISETIVLEPIQKGNLLGTIVNEDDDTPIANAKVRVLEEPGLYIVTDSNGNYTINDLLAGDYTLKVTSSSHYSTTKLVQVIGNEDNIVDITMERFVTNGDPDEIAYDDGSHEDGRTFTNPGAGFGVRFTPEKFGRLKSAKIYFIGDHPTAVGTEINIGVVKVDDRGNIVHFSPMRKITIERGAWNTIDLTDFDVLTDEDFYIVTQQIHPLAGSPRIGIDTSSTADRSYVFNGGSLVKLNGADGYNIPGGMLMRAIMEYPSSGYVAKPVISNLDVNNYINTDNLTIEGSIALDAKVNIYVNNSLVKTIDTVAKKFSSVIQLASETNIIRLEAQIGDALSGKTDPINVIVDKLAPVVEITNPVTNISTKETSLVVTGKVTDKNLDYVSVNSKKIQVALDGNFTENIELQKGKNILTVIATDKAGNSTTVTREIFCGEEVVNLTNLLPAENILTEIGKSVKVSFNAPTGGKGYFKLVLPMGGLNTEESYGRTMTEVSEGLYEGTWTIPVGFVAKGLEIEFTFVSAGNEVVTAKAPGKISIKQAIMFELENITPTEDSILKVGDKLEVSFNAPVEGNGSFNIVGEDVNIEIAMEEIEAGLYKGIWTVPAGLENKELEINVEFVSKEGFEAVGKAAGKINIRELKPEEISTHIVNLPNNSVIFDGVAYDMDYLESYANGQIKLIAWHNAGKDIFVKKLDGTLVNFKDEEITIELLPDSIIYYSINGKATIYTK